MIDLPLVSVGPAAGRPLLVLHGGPGETHHVLRPHLDALVSERRRVVYYDQRRLADHLRHVADVDAVRRALGHERIDVLGFSWGALLALLFALEHPQRVARMVLVSAPPLHSGDREVIRARLAEAAARPSVRELQGSSFVTRVAPAFFEPARALELTPVETREECARAAQASLGQYDLRPKLSSLRGVPALVVHGAADPIPSSIALETASLLGASSCILERSGHAPFVEARESFVAYVARFLDDDEPSMDSRGGAR